jgi:hypothetical protein
MSTQNPKRLPYGNADFKKIRTNNCVSKNVFSKLSDFDLQRFDKKYKGWNN